MSICELRWSDEEGNPHLDPKEKHAHYWVAVKELELSYHNPETRLFTIYPEYGNLKESSSTASQMSPDSSQMAFLKGERCRESLDAGRPFSFGFNRSQFVWVAVKEPNSSCHNMDI